MRYFHLKQQPDGYDPFPYYLFLGKVIFSNSLPLSKAIQLEAVKGLLQNFAKITQIRNLDRSLSEINDDWFYTLANQFLVRLLCKITWDDENDIPPLMGLASEQ